MGQQSSRLTAHSGEQCLAACASSLRKRNPSASHRPWGPGGQGMLLRVPAGAPSSQLRVPTRPLRYAEKQGPGWGVRVGLGSGPSPAQGGTQELSLTAKAGSRKQVGLGKPASLRGHTRLPVHGDSTRAGSHAGMSSHGVQPGIFCPHICPACPKPSDPGEPESPQVPRAPAGKAWPLPGGRGHQGLGQEAGQTLLPGG